MNDYIEREKALNALCHGEGCGNVCSRSIRNITAADVCPVVRCKDCDWWIKRGASLQGRCSRFGIYTTETWFCASGVRCRGNVDPSKEDD